MQLFRFFLRPFPFLLHFFGTPSRLQRRGFLVVLISVDSSELLWLPGVIAVVARLLASAVVDPSWSVRAEVADVSVRAEAVGLVGLVGPEVSDAFVALWSSVTVGSISVAPAPSSPLVSSLSVVAIGVSEGKVTSVAEMLAPAAVVAVDAF